MAAGEDSTQLAFIQRKVQENYAEELQHDWMKEKRQVKDYLTNIEILARAR